MQTRVSLHLCVFLALWLLFLQFVWSSSKLFVFVFSYYIYFLIIP